MNIEKTKYGITKAVNVMKDFWQDETASGVVELILIIVVLIGLVLVFKEQINKVVNDIFSTITAKSNQVLAN